MKILLSAYACDPGGGSEAGAGWNWARHLARLEEVWVVTRGVNREPIERAVAAEPLPGLHPVYVDLPRSMRFCNQGSLGIRLCYYLWQVLAWWRARRLHQEISFDVAHHVTCVNYCMPGFMAWLDVPFVWGPVAGGESAPSRFWWSFSLRGKIDELARDIARRLGHLDPFVRWTARRSALAMATTSQTERAVQSAGARQTAVFPAAGISDEEIERLGKLPLRTAGQFRLISVGSLLHSNALELSVLAFARFAQDRADAEYWILGSGPERARLEWLVEVLGMCEKVTLCGSMPRSVVLEKLAGSDAMVHPALHDSGGSVQAMAAAKPVVCLNLGGPGAQITQETGIRIPPVSPEQVVRDMARAFHTLAADPALREKMGAAGRRRVAEHFAWMQKSLSMLRFYQHAQRSFISSHELSTIRQHRSESI